MSTYLLRSLWKVVKLVDAHCALPSRVTSPRNLEGMSEVGKQKTSKHTNKWTRICSSGPAKFRRHELGGKTSEHANKCTRVDNNDNVLPSRVASPQNLEGMSEVEKQVST
jgi:hypothetical protein